MQVNELDIERFELPALAPRVLEGIQTQTKGGDVKRRENENDRYVSAQGQLEDFRFQPQGTARSMDMTQ